MKDWDGGCDEPTAVFLFFLRATHRVLAVVLLLALPVAVPSCRGVQVDI